MLPIYNHILVRKITFTFCIALIFHMFISIPQKEKVKTLYESVINVFLETQLPYIVKDVYSGNFATLQVRSEYLLLKDEINYEMQIDIYESGTIYTSNAYHHCFKEKIFPTVVSYQGKDYLCENKELKYLDEDLGSVTAAYQVSKDPYNLLPNGSMVLLVLTCITIIICPDITRLRNTTQDNLKKLDLTKKMPGFLL